MLRKCNLCAGPLQSMLIPFDWKLHPKKLLLLTAQNFSDSPKGGFVPFEPKGVVDEVCVVEPVPHGGRRQCHYLVLPWIAKPQSVPFPRNSLQPWSNWMQLCWCKFISANSTPAPLNGRCFFHRQSCIHSGVVSEGLCGTDKAATVSFQSIAIFEGWTRLFKMPLSTDLLYLLETQVGKGGTQVLFASHLTTLSPFMR